MVAEDCNLAKCTLLLNGYLRAHSLSVNQLVITSTISMLAFMDRSDGCG